MFNELPDIFETIADLDYVILRNHEEFEDMNFLSSHPDIDILCRDRNAIVCRLDLRPRRRKDDEIHYYVKVARKKVAVDLRCVGDGYLDARWEDQILQSKVQYKNFYVMNESDYFYSLLYHVVVQKHTVAEDYLKRLKEMSLTLSVDFQPDRKEECLDTFMEEKHYLYTYPEYLGTIFNVSKVRESLVEKNTRKHLKRMVYAFTKKIWCIFKK